MQCTKTQGSVRSPCEEYLTKKKAVLTSPRIPQGFSECSSREAPWDEAGQSHWDQDSSYSVQWWGGFIIKIIVDKININQIILHDFTQKLELM